MIRSTYATFTKMFARASVSDRLGRTEPLVLSGPQKYVRHPLYLSVILAVLGWGLATASSVVLLEALAFALWFALVQIPFEERELRVLYGDQYTRYAARTSMLIPLPRRRSS